jgi:hypothetical protein
MNSLVVVPLQINISGCIKMLRGSLLIVAASSVLTISFISAKFHPYVSISISSRTLALASKIFLGD